MPISEHQHFINLF